MERLNEGTRLRMYQLAAEVLATAGKLIARDLNRGSAGNVSVRYADGCIITPTGIEHQDCTPDDMVKVGIKVGAGETADVPESTLNRRKPSSELRFHRGGDLVCLVFRTDIDQRHTDVALRVAVP